MSVTGSQSNAIASVDCKKINDFVTYLSANIFFRLKRHNKDDRMPFLNYYLECKSLKNYLTAVLLECPFGGVRSMKKRQPHLDDN